MVQLHIAILLTGLLTVNTQWYESLITVTPLSFEIQPLSSSDLLDTLSNVMNIARCVGFCNYQQLCRFIDYDLATSTCRLFSNGVPTSSSLVTSQAGTVYEASSLYASYGEACSSTNCEINRYLICGAGNTCQCPATLVWNAPECVVTVVPPATPQLSSGVPLVNITNPSSFSYPAYTPYSFAWVANGSSATLSFVFRQDPGTWFLDDITVYHGMTQLISNGGFENGSLAGWTYFGSCNSYAGQVQNSNSDAHTGSWYYGDGCTQSTDTISETFPTIAGDTYIISFWLTNDGCCAPTEIALVTIA